MSDYGYKEKILSMYGKRITRTYEQGVKDGYNLYLNKNYPHNFTLYGKTLEEIHKIIAEYEARQFQWTEEELKILNKREKKMTREEAIKKCTEAFEPKQGWTGINKQALEDLISTIEALGLIKFEEEKKMRFELYNPSIDAVEKTNSIDDVRNWLHDGFRITKDNG